MISHEKTFGSPYPLPKLDMIAVPGHSGAMENWDCVIYDDMKLVRGKSDTSVFDMERNARTVIHKLAHQWFGNIVTNAWWDNLWLNESFADWAKYNAIVSMFPDWEEWSSFVAGHPGIDLNAYQAALALDSYRRSHPIEVPISTPEEMFQIFDAITYAKGCSVLRMISEYLGVDLFIEGVRLYLQRHAYGNAKTNDLWEALSTVSGKNVQEVMFSWTQKVGYPVLSITEDEATNTIEISQHRFLQSGDLPAEDDQVRYPVYLKTKTRIEIDQEANLPSISNSIQTQCGTDGLVQSFLSINPMGEAGKQLSSGLLTADDRVGLLSAFRAAVTSSQRSKIRTSDFLNFLKAFREEVNCFVWRQILVCLQDIRKAWLFEDAATQYALSKFQTDLMYPVLRKLDCDLWNFKKSDNFQEQSLKAVLFANSGDYPPVKTVANNLFKRFTDGDGKVLNSNFRRVVFNIVLSDPKAGPDQYTSVLTTFRETPSPSTRADALTTLGVSPSPSSIAQTLYLATSSQTQSSNDRNAVLTSLRVHADGVLALWEWMKENWGEIEREVAKIMGGVVLGVYKGGFFRAVDTKKFDTFLEQSLDEIRTKARWVERLAEIEWIL